MWDVPFGVTLSLSGVRKELGKTDDGESNEKARFGVFGCPPLGVPGTGAGAANTLNSARRSRVSS